MLVGLTVIVMDGCGFDEPPPPPPHALSRIANEHAAAIAPARADRETVPESNDMSDPL
jgi:hypothetical protein